MIAICTDSNSQLPAELRDRFDVEVVPLTVTLDGIDHLEGVDLDADAFYAAFAEGHTPEVSTSQPSPGRFVEAYRRLADRGATAIVSVHVTAAMSGTLGAATLAATESPVPVRTVDSGTASFGIACSVWAAGLARDAGHTIDGVADAAAQLAPSIGSAFVVGVPLLIRQGGRAEGLDLEGDGIPVLSMDGGELTVLDRVRDVGAAVGAMTAYALDRGPRILVAVGTSDGSSRPVADALTAELADHPAVVDLVPYRIGPSVGAHTGPGTAGLFVFRARPGQAPI
ncbi:MAG: DegV family protein [Ilumatobacteraceae bacterium]